LHRQDPQPGALVPPGCGFLSSVPMKNQTALITGASSGIGLHLAYEFARHGHPLVVVAPVEAELNIVAANVRKEFDLPVEVIAVDLELETAAQSIKDRLNEKRIEVSCLVNNAGHGYRGQSSDLTIEQDLSMVRLNIEAVLRLTKLFLPRMIGAGAGKVLNTASIAGFEPGPLLAVYHATKAFVLSWSEALAVELENTGVTVTALCPGATDTDFFPKADMLGTKAFQSSNVMAPQDVARAGYKAMMDGELFVVPGGMNKALVASRRVLSERAQAKLNEKFYQEVPPEERTRDRGDVEAAANRR
jgi:short-subunit dehydrogenase